MKRFAFVVCISCTVLGCSGESSDRVRYETGSSQLGGKLLVEPSHHQLGTMLGGTGKTHSAETRLKNVGRRRLRIYDLLVSCDCTNATVSEKDLEPGESTILRTELKVGDSPGLRKSIITIRSTDESGVPQSISFEWETDNLLKSSERSFILSDLPRKQSYQFDIPIKSDHLAICRDCRFKTSQVSELIKTSLTIDPAIVGIDHVHGDERPESSELGIVHVEILPQPENSQYDSNIVLELTCGQENRARLVLPITWTYDRPLLAAPASLSLGIQKPGELVRKDLYIRGSKNRLFRIKSISGSQPDMVSDQKYPPESASDAFVAFSIRVPSKKGPWREMIVVRTDLDEAAEIQVPVSGIVED